MRKLLLLATLLLAFPLLAATLGLYKEWDSSPASYYMTFDERAQWAKLQTEAEADAFVKQFIAARGGEKFTAELNKRIQIADKHLTVGKQPGSQTTRGKIIIVLGPPQGMQVTERQNKSGRSGTAAASVASGTRDGGASANDMADVSQRDSMSGTDVVKIYTFTYPNLVVPVEVNPTTGKDRIRDRKANAALERALEAAAKASVVAK
ncbi:MAG TPA: GWxTD domain-containing protein [Thermoanaerobaculia bacterium]